MARGKQNQEDFLVDGIGTIDGGMNAGLMPQLIGKNQAAMSTNMTFRGGYGTHRPPIREIKLDFKGDLVLESNCTTKAFQGACFYQPDTGNQSLVAAIGGRLFQFFPSETNSPVLDISVPNDPNPSNPQQAWLWQSERFVIWNDGVSLPVFFDGSISRRSNGTNKILAVISGSFPAPAVGETVNVTLTEAYTGPVNIPVLVNGKQFVLLSTNTSSPSAAMGAIYDPDSSHSIGEKIISYPNRLGTLLSDIPAGVSSVQARTSNFVSVVIGQVIQIGTSQFTVTGYNPNGGNVGIFPTQILSLSVVQQPFFPPGFHTPGGSTIQNQPTTTPSLIPSGSIITIASTAPTPTVGEVGTDFSPSYPVGVNIAVSPTYTGPNQVVWVGKGQYFITPITVPPSTTVVLQNVGATEGDAVSGNITALPELPPGRMGVYGMGRNWMALTDGFSFIASDIVGGTSGTEVYNFRDAPLRVTENTYLAGGGAFRVPGSLGEIRAMRFSATLDTSLGQGPLQVFTTQAAFSCAAPVDRLTWTMIENPILTQSLLGAGALSQNGTVLVNGDILFRAIDGSRSLILARRDFDTWGNVPQSREVETILSQDNATLIQFESATVFENRHLLSVLPTNGPLGVFCQGVIALNFDPISTLRGKAPSIYDGLWTGLNILQLVSGVFNGVERCYAFCYDSFLSKIRLFELQKTADGPFDNGVTPVTYSFESAALFNDPKIKGQFDLAEMVDGEIYVSDIRGIVNFEVWYRPNYSDCWTKWTEFGICANNTDTSKPNQYRSPIGLGSPSVDDCDPNTKQPTRIGLTFQVRFQITGSCRFRGAKFKAIQVPETKFSVAQCKPLCDVISDSEECEPCVLISNCIQFPLVLYNLNANKTYQNDAAVIDVQCQGGLQKVPVPAGTISFTLPFGPGYTGTYPPLVLNCLSGGVIVKIIPSGSTQDQIDLIVNEMINECVTAYAESLAALNPQCTSNAETFTSDQVQFTVNCSGRLLIYLGTLPSWITLNESAAVMTGAAGIATGPTKSEATATAQAMLDEFCQAALSNGTLLCDTRPDWSQLDWTLVDNHAGSGGTASGTYNGGDFNVEALGVDGANVSYSRALGTLTFTGSSASCKASVNVTATGANNMGFAIFQDGVQKLNVTTADLGSIGVHEFSFSIDAGTNSVIEIRGTIDISLPSRLFVYSFNNTQGAYSASISNDPL